MLEYSTEHIAKIVSGVLVGETNTMVNSIVFDSRNLTTSPGALFIAIKGQRHDGHKYVKMMYERGVRSFLVSDHNNNFKELNKASFILVGNTLKALQQLASYHRSEFSLNVLGITGSNGKTIIKEWLASCLTKTQNIVRSPKSFNSQLGVPLSVLNISNGHTCALIEAGISKQGEMQYLEKIIRPTEGLITNIGDAHQEGFGSIDEKLNEKLLLFDSCERIFYCADHDLIHNELISNRKYHKKELIGWSFKDPGSALFIKKKESSLSETVIEVIHANNIYTFFLPFIDAASIENCLQVMNYLFYSGYNKQEVQQCIRELHPIAMRMEQIQGVRNCMLINDAYNSDINALGIAVDYLMQLSTGISVCILSDIQQSGMSLESLYTRVAEIIVATGVDRFIGVGKEIGSMQACFKESNADFYPSVEDFLQSGEYDKMSDATILIKGARGFKFEQIVQALSKKNHTTVLEANLNNLVHNLNYFRSLITPSTGIMVMVKALAYGSGSNEIANILQHEKVNYLGVAFTDEGVELRNRGVTLPIMVMAPAAEDFERLVENNLEPEIYGVPVLKKFIKEAEKQQLVNYPIHLKVDTGMHRLGFLEDEIDEVLILLSRSSAVMVKTVFSHLAASDESEHDAFTKKQIKILKAVSDKISGFLGYKHIRHIVNSAGIERFPEAHFEMVRLGIGLHGVSQINSALLPVSTLKTHIVQIKKISSDETVGYSRKGKFESDSKIAILPVGYADGLNRKLGNGNAYVSISGKKAFYVGNICMDLCMVDISNIDCAIGDEVIIFGADPKIQTLAEAMDTIPYEVLTNVSERVKRIYLKD